MGLNTCDFHSVEFEATNRSANLRSGSFTSLCAFSEQIRRASAFTSLILLLNIIMCQKVLPEQMESLVNAGNPSSYKQKLRWPSCSQRCSLHASYPAVLSVFLPAF